MKLSVPYGLVLESIGKISSNVPFIMPKRVAETDAFEQIKDYTGSGPFKFEAAEWRPGAKVVRSDEHTSELRSLMRISHAAFCLTKKNTKHTHHHYHINNHK